MKANALTVNGIPIRWGEQGEGDPVVLIHGIPTSPALWRYVAPLVHGRCLAFEMVGYGYSAAAGERCDISVAKQADYVAAWLKAIGVERAVFAGHDLGGGVVQNIAVRYPGICNGIFLTNSICYDSWPIPGVKALHATSTLSRQLPDIAVKQIFRSLMYRGHEELHIANESLQLHWQPYEREGAAKLLLRQIDSLDVNDTQSVAPALPTLHIPARILWGAADQFQKVGYGERLARDLHAPLTRIEQGKHFTPEDHPGAVAGEINYLLQEVHPRPPFGQPRPGMNSHLH